MKLGNKLMAVLKEVHEKKSYRFDYASFEDYCAKEWKITASRAYQIIKGENFRALLIEAGGDERELESLNERQIDALSKTTPSKANKILKKIRDSGEKITAKKIATIIDPEVLPPASCKTCPTCHQPIKKPRPLPD